MVGQFLGIMVVGAHRLHDLCRCWHGVCVRFLSIMVPRILIVLQRFSVALRLCIASAFRFCAPLVFRVREFLAAVSVEVPK